MILAVSVGIPGSVCYYPVNKHITSLGSLNIFSEIEFMFKTDDSKAPDQFLNLPARSHRTVQIRFIDPGQVPSLSQED